MGCFVNFSNHATEMWSDKQVKEAHKYGEIVYIPFPDVPPLYDCKDVEKLAKKYADMIMQNNPTAVMCQGEFTLCYAVVNILKEKKIKTLAACSKRKSVMEPNGKRITYFVFEQFREY